MRLRITLEVEFFPFLNFVLPDSALFFRPFLDRDYFEIFSCFGSFLPSDLQFVDFAMFVF